MGGGNAAAPQKTVPKSPRLPLAPYRRSTARASGRSGDSGNRGEDVPEDQSGRCMSTPAAARPAWWKNTPSAASPDIRRLATIARMVSDRTQTSVTTKYEKAARGRREPGGRGPSRRSLALSPPSGPRPGVPEPASPNSAASLAQNAGRETRSAAELTDREYSCPVAMDRLAGARAMRRGPPGRGSHACPGPSRCGRRRRRGGRCSGRRRSRWPRGSAVLPRRRSARTPRKASASSGKSSGGGGGHSPW